MALRVTQVRMNIDRAKVQQLVIASANAGVGRAGRVLLNFIDKSFVPTARFTPSPPGGPPGTGTGDLRRSMAMTEPANMRASITTSSKYARVHEYGGILRPTTKKYLTVPVNVTAAKMRANTKDLRTLNLTFRKGSNPGHAFLFRTTKGKNARSELMFVLKRFVRLPARPFLRPAVRNQQVRGNMGKAFAAGFRATFRTGFRSLIGVTP